MFCGKEATIRNTSCINCPIKNLGSNQSIGIPNALRICYKQEKRAHDCRDVETNLHGDQEPPRR